MIAITPKLWNSGKSWIWEKPALGLVNISINRCVMRFAWTPAMMQSNLSQKSRMGRASGSSIEASRTFCPHDWSAVSVGCASARFLSRPLDFFLTSNCHVSGAEDSTIPIWHLWNSVRSLFKILVSKSATQYLPEIHVRTRCPASMSD